MKAPIATSGAFGREPSCIMISRRTADAHNEAVLDFEQGATMNNRCPRQLELFSDGAKPLARRRPSKPALPSEAELQARLDAARMRLHEIVILRMMTWLSVETQKGLREAETIRREQVRMHFRILACFRGEQLADMRGRST
jgi:hypothetical protein